MELLYYFATVMLLGLFFIAFLGRFILFNQIGGLRDSRQLIDAGMLFLTVFSASLLIVPFFFFGPEMTGFLSSLAPANRGDQSGVGSFKDRLLGSVLFSPLFHGRGAAFAQKIIFAADSIAILLVSALVTVFIVVTRRNTPDHEPVPVPPHTFEFNPVIIEQLNKN